MSRKSNRRVSGWHLRPGQTCLIWHLRAAEGVPFGTFARCPDDTHLKNIFTKGKPGEGQAGFARRLRERAPALGTDLADFPTSGLLVSPITAEPSMPEHAHDPGRLVEAYVQMWLRETMVGRRFLRGRSLDDATEAVFELLNAGFLKLAGSTAGITGISVSTPPRPPRRRLRRPRSTLNGANGTVK